MKLHLKKTGLLIAGLTMGSQLMAQTTDSTKNYVQPFSGGSPFRTWSVGLQAGMSSINTLFQDKGDYVTANERLMYGGYVKKQLLHGLGLQATFMRGHIQGSGPRDMSYPIQRFETKVKYAVDLQAVVTLANINWRSQQSFIQPYVSFGAGNMAFTSTLTANNGTTTGVGNTRQWYIPVGTGLKFNLGPVVNLDLGYQVNFVNGDNLDQYYRGDKRDKYGMAHAGLEFALGRSSKPQLAAHNPVASMRYEYLMEQRRLQGEIDAQKAENRRLRTDLDATNANIARMTTDSDGDGVVDINDKCPNTPAGTKVDGSGCPLPPPVTPVRVVVTEEDRRVVREAIKNLEFEFGKATIREKSFPSLQRVAKVLVDKNFSLKLAGHTDNVGSADANMKLSKDRAESVKAYLVEQGANPSRIEAVGYGKNQPIATNKTEAGRQKNRRVEFTLY